MQPVVQPVAQRAQARRLSLAISCLHELRRLAEADDARHVERARAHAALVAAAVMICATSSTRGLRRRTYSAPTPFGPYILCALIDTRSTFSSLHVERNLADRLHRVGVEQDALLLRDRADLRDRLDDADLVVRAS